MTVNELFEDGPIMVSVEKIRGSQIKIGADASKALEVARGELVTA